jgi:hypothetical protein
MDEIVEGLGESIVVFAIRQISYKGHQNSVPFPIIIADVDACSYHLLGEVIAKSQPRG